MIFFLFSLIVEAVEVLIDTTVCYCWCRLGLVSVPIPGLSAQPSHNLQSRLKRGLHPVWLSNELHVMDLSVLGSMSIDL